MTYSIGEVAKILDISPQLIRNWENSGFIQKPKRRPTNRRRYSNEDIQKIEEYLKRR